MAESIDILIGVGIGTVIFFLLLSGCYNCYCKDSPSTVTSISSTRNNSLSVNNRVQIEDSDNKLERTEDL